MGVGTDVPSFYLERNDASVPQYLQDGRVDHGMYNGPNRSLQ